MSSQRGIVLLVVGMCMIGTYSAVSKIMVESIPPFTTAILRLGIGSLFLWLIVWIRAARGIRATWPSRKERPVVLVHALVGVLLFSVLSLLGLQRASALDAGILMGLTPVIIAVLAALTSRVYPTARGTIAILIAATAAVAVGASNATDSGQSSTTLGIVLIFGAVFCEAVFVSAAGLLKTAVCPIMYSALLSTVACVLLAIPASLELGDWQWQSVPTSAWLATAYAGIAITVVGNVALTVGNQKCDVHLVAVGSSLLPVAGAVAAVLVVGETWGLWDAVGLLATIVAILLIAKDSNRSAAS